MRKKQGSVLGRATAELFHDIFALEWHDVQASIVFYCQTIVLPVLLGLFGLALVWELGRKIWHSFSPPGLYQKHVHAKYLYRMGNVKGACQEWNNMARLSVGSGCFAPAVMSLACHEIYAVQDYAKGVRILKQALDYETRQRRRQPPTALPPPQGEMSLSTATSTSFSLLKDKNPDHSKPTTSNSATTQTKRRYPLNRKAVDAMILDADAYLAGNGIMVERMNAPLAKLEYLGISTRTDAARVLNEPGHRRRRLW
jgi:hypothetical protein